MIEDKDFQPIDELFRKTFEQQLPDAPASSGWDLPADRVWQNVQATFPQPAAGSAIGLKSIFVVAALAITVGSAAIYWYSSAKNVSPLQPTAPAQQETMHSAPVASPSVSVPVENSAKVTREKPVETGKPKTSADVKNKNANAPVNSRQAAQGKDQVRQEGEPLPEKQ